MSNLSVKLKTPDSNKCIDLSFNNGNNGTPIKVAGCSGDVAQSWV